MLPTGALVTLLDDVVRGDGIQCSLDHGDRGSIVACPQTGARLLHGAGGGTPEADRGEGAVVERSDGASAVVPSAADAFVIAVRVAGRIGGARRVANHGKGVDEYAGSRRCRMPSSVTRR